MALRPAIFLDRDGTLNVEKKYLHTIKEWEWISGAIDALARFQAAGFALVVITNQAGIARGMYTAKEVHILHEWVARELAAHDIIIDGFYFCPHHPDFRKMGEELCDCRKPKAGMLLQAALELGIDLARSWMIGDRLSDIEAGNAAGARGILVKTGYGTKEAASAPKDLLVAEDISAAYTVIYPKI
jgi:D-glycero-D-manno-heptose 1,7-bisphosphate phosphatase